MTQQDNNTERDDRQERYQRRRSNAHKSIPIEAPPRRRAPYKRQHVDYDHYLQEEELEDEWFEHNS